MSKFVFFLGGYDAEMVEIRNILESGNQQFFDNKLSWGACLSSYREEIGSLSEDKIPVFIELKPDCSYPEHSILIDHHDERAGKDKKTSIEQVAELLKIKLDRRQQLISANDKEHIRAMQKLCASPKEIEGIRAFDRKAQGVTEKDEHLAGESIKKRLERIGDTCVIINSLTNRTSSVFDKIYNKYKHVFINTPDGKMHYAGTGDMIYRLCTKYESLKYKDPSIEYWSGGSLPDYGFFGTKTPLAKEELKKMLQDTNYSHHIFMFPFTISCTENNGDEKSASDFMEAISNALEDDWQEESFDPELNNWNYSEFFYFHHFVRDSLFSLKQNSTGQKDSEDKKKISGNNDKSLLKYFKRDLGSNGKFTLRIITDNGSKKTYDLNLDIDHISLRIFETRIGILTIELINKQYESLDDILKINDFGRRIYPQFLGESNGVDDTKKSFLANKIIMKFNDGKFNSVEDFCETRFKKDHLVVADYIEKLLGKHFTSDPKKFDKDNIPFLYKPTIDDRMYVVCWYGSEKWSRILKNKNKKGFYEYERNHKWYRFIFHDGNFPNCQHPGMMQRLIKESTYERWTDFGTFYGINRYGLVCISKIEEDVFGYNFGYDIIRNHMRKQYAQIAVILLAQRASILRFSEEVANISAEIQKPNSPENNIDKEGVAQILGNVENLHASYIRFVNRLWFTEVTPQEQGIEMYDQAVKIMKLKENMQDLKSEIKELYEFVSISNDRLQIDRDRETNKKMHTLTILGSIFLPIMVITGFFGMNLKFIDKNICHDILGWFSETGHMRLEIILWLVSILGFSGVFILLYLWMRKHVKYIYETDFDIWEYLTLKHLFFSKSDKKNQKNKASNAADHESIAENERRKK